MKLYPKAKVWYPCLLSYFNKNTFLFDRSFKPWCTIIDSGRFSLAHAKSQTWIKNQCELHNVTNKQTQIWNKHSKSKKSCYHHQHQHIKTNATAQTSSHAPSFLSTLKTGRPDLAKSVMLVTRALSHPAQCPAQNQDDFKATAVIDDLIFYLIICKN